MQGPLWPRIYVKMGARSARSRVIPSGAQDSEYEPHSSVNEPVQSLCTKYPLFRTLRPFHIPYPPLCASQPDNQRLHLHNPEPRRLYSLWSSSPRQWRLDVPLNLPPSSRSRLVLCYVMFGVWGYRAVVYLKRNDE